LKSGVFFDPIGELMALAAKSHISKDHGPAILTLAEANVIKDDGLAVRGSAKSHISIHHGAAVI